MDRTFGLEDLKKELREDLDYTIERNFAVFVKKYDFQAQLMSDRIIHAVEAAVGSGSHSRIKNVVSIKSPLACLHTALKLASRICRTYGKRWCA